MQTVYERTIPALDQSYNSNGLNQYTSVGGAAFGYSGGDGARGNLVSDGSRTFDYDLENRLLSVSAGGSTIGSLTYDPLGRVRSYAAAGNTTIFLYDGDRLVEEYTGAGVRLRRYAHGAGIDEPLIWYESSGVASGQNWLIADRQGSIVATTNSAGVATTYAYDAYGIPREWTGPRFRYTGQAALPELQLYHYKARVYDPGLGRFLQTDPPIYAAGDRCMATTMIPDDRLLAEADIVTVWVGTPDAPADVWSLAEAVAWVMRQPDRGRITLFRPPGKDLRAAWVELEQIERLAFALNPEPASSAA